MQSKIQECRQYTAALAAANTDIAAHAVLANVLDAVLEAKPKTIVEIGTGVNGLRTKVICKAGSIFSARHVSCDIRDCTGCGNSWNSNWTFILIDGRELAKKWPPQDKIDVLLIDTDEHYETTLQVWEAWKPFLSEGATVMFRCSNLQKTLFYADGSSTEKGWDNSRGVARVIEGIVKEPITEKVEFAKTYAEWDVKHWPWGAGLTVMRRLS